MGWYISEAENTVALTDECIDELFEKRDTFYCMDWDDRDSIFWTNRGGTKLLYFSEDHMEHMDYLANNEKIIEIMQKHNLRGDICFESVEGDNAGDKWGYRFDGKGGFKNLRGVTAWEEYE